MIDLSSDTATRPSPGMRQAMAEAVVGDEQRREDPTVNALQDMVAELTGKEAGLFLPSGTMCNVVAIAAHVRPGDAIILEKGCHIATSEGGGAAWFAGAMMRGIPGERGVYTTEQARAEVSAEGTHTSRSSLLCIENTANRGGGTVWPIERIRELRALCDEAGMQFHMDGARLMNAAVASGIDARVYGSLVDTTWIDLSKGLGAPVGAVLVGSREFIERARLLKHRFGGAMRQAGVIAAAGIYAFEHNVERLAEDHANAKYLEAEISKISGLKQVNGPVETNIFYFDTTGIGLTGAEFGRRMEAKGVRMSPYNNEGLVRCVTHLDATRAECEVAVAMVKEVVAQA